MMSCSEARRSIEGQELRETAGRRYEMHEPHANVLRAVFRWLKRH
jgi:hypothetical protein